VVHWEARFPAIPLSVGAIRGEIEAIARRCRLDEKRVGDIKLAVSEAATNVVLHAYPGAEAGKVHVLAECSADSLQVTVSDDGGGMLPRPDSPGLGLGLPLIAQLVDGLEVGSTQGGGTSMCMRFEFSVR
jgi:anti-sigma regulatory factor (Ser/Thr protein kinase)